ncbi:unnamed protein product [Amoebophrya sp. A120]|nr:unnamed protein product [Amoebophrya sp. A120]|eukprot:GSA120T00008299001.1
MFTKATQFGSYAEATEVQAVAKGLLKQKKEGLLDEEDVTQGADFADVVRAVVDTLNRPSARDVISHLLAEGESRSKTYYGHYKGCTGPKLRDVLGQAVNCLVAINVLAVQHLKFTDSRQRRVEYDALFVPLREAAASSSKPAGRGQGKAPAAQPPPPAASSSRSNPNISADTGAKSKNASAVSSSSSVVPAQAKKAPAVSGSRGPVLPTSSIGPFAAAGSSAGSPPWSRWIVAGKPDALTEADCRWRSGTGSQGHRRWRPGSTGSWITNSTTDPSLCPRKDQQRRHDRARQQTTTRPDHGFDAATKLA